MQSNAREKRSAKLALAFGSVWLDLDGKDFQSPGEGADVVFEKILTRLRDFYTTAGLPRPSVMVWSGGGAHAYWLVDQPMPKGRWTVIAQALRAAAEESGLPADLQCTTDAARVLRIAGTENRKPEYENPSPAKVTFPADKAAPNRYPPEVLEAALATHMRAQVVAAKNRGNNVVLLDPKLFPPRSPIPQTELSAGIDADLQEIRSAVDAVPAAAIADEGNWVRFARALAHPASIYRSQAEDLWAILDEASQRAPGYDAGENRQRWLRYIEEARRHENPITIGTLFYLARSHGWPDSQSATITSQVTAPASKSRPADTGGAPETAKICNASGTDSNNTAENTVLYVPGNEEACRLAVDRVVAEDERVFTPEGSGFLSILRVPDQDTYSPPTRRDDELASIRWDGDLPGTTLATVPDIMERAERLKWLKPCKQGTVRIHPPQNFVANYLQQMRGRYAARVLRGIARVPRIDDDGQIHFPSGYDATTRLYHDKTPTFDVPASPSADDVVKAVKALQLPFSEYQFESQTAGEALLLGAIFTAIERPYLPTAPMLIVRSSMAATGKGLLVRSLTQLAYDTFPVFATWGATPEETEKRIASLLLQSPGAICIDNANGKMIQGDLLESIITEGRADIRILGRSEMVRVHNRSLLLLTGNNPQSTGDMARRTLNLDIKPRSADPERDRYKIKPVDLIRRRRDDFLRAAFTIMRAYRVAGMPSQGLPGVGSFDLWSRRVRDLVHWVNGYDLADAFKQNKAEDPHRQDDATLLAALDGIFGTAPFRSSDVFAVYTEVANAKRTALQQAVPDPKKTTLHATLDAVLGSRGGVSAKLFGYWARKVKGAHIGGFQLNVRHDPATNANAITVRRT